MRHPPAELTPLIGREQEVEAICRLLAAGGVRLLTLTGPGGTGKTRLALAAAAALAGVYPDGIGWIPLGASADAGRVPSAVAEGLGLDTRGGVPISELIGNYLAGRRLLLILDCFEQVVAAAPLLSELLAGAAGLRLLVTSRILLHLSAEHNFPVPPLALPAAADLDCAELAGYASVALFAMRAAAFKPSFALGPDNAPYVAEICRRLDGLPLAIELAAARVRLLSPQALLARLERRLPLLTGGPSDLPERQRTLYAAIDWSYRLLAADEQALFCRLAVFAGAWDLPGAEAVVKAGHAFEPDVLEALTWLVDKSLLQQVEGLDGEPRFAMLDTIREFGLEQLEAGGAATEARRDHALYFTGLAEAGETGLRGREQQAWSRRLTADQDNFREALRWAAGAGESEIALRLAAALWPFWERHGNWDEGIAWLQLALALPGGTPRSRARAMIGLAFLQQFTWTDTSEALAVLEGSRDLAHAVGDADAEATALLVLGRMWAENKDFATGLALMQDGAALARAAGARWTLAWILFWSGWETLFAGHTPDRVVSARAAWHESLALYTECGDSLGRADVLSQLALLDGMQAAEQAGYLAAVERATEAVATFRALNHRPGLVRTLSSLGEIARYHGDCSRAQAAYEQDLLVGRSMGLAPTVSLGNQAAVAVLQDDWPRAAQLVVQAWPAHSAGAKQGMVAFILVVFGGVCALRGQAAAAVTLLGAAQAAFDRVGGGLQPPDQQVFDRALSQARSALSEAELASAWAHGRDLSLQQAYDFGREQLAQPTPQPAVPVPDAAQAGAGVLTIPGSPETLTERELEVLRLVSQGLSNREVADRLVLSPLTVSAHLRSIYGKLGVNSRTAAARFAIDHKLL